MGDQYLLEHHAYAIAHKAYSGRKHKIQGSDAKFSWVMLSREGDIVKLPRETMLHRPWARISLELSVPNALQGRTPFSVECSDGKVYMTSQRIIYVPARPTAQFKSFAAPILNFEDSYISSPWFGSWYWAATVKPVSQGGIPADVPRISIRLSFKEGGHNDFREKFEQIKERLFHARDLERELGQRVLVPEEPLPVYEASYGGGSSANNGQTRAEFAPAGREETPGRRPPPNEPPPGYEEAQAQEVSIRLEDHIRDEANRI